MSRFYPIRILKRSEFSEGYYWIVEGPIKLNDIFYHTCSSDGVGSNTGYDMAKKKAEFYNSLLDLGGDDKFSVQIKLDGDKHKPIVIGPKGFFLPYKEGYESSANSYADFLNPIISFGGN